VTAGPGRYAWFGVAAVALALALGGLASSFASGSPDGLERVADEQGISDRATGHALAGSPVADYSLRGAPNDTVGTGAAGVLGVLATLAAGSGVAVLLHRRRRSRADLPPAASGTAPSTAGAPTAAAPAPSARSPIR
jgi:cobalt/nickel transport system permease protein